MHIFLKVGHIFEDVDIYLETSTYTLKCGHIFLNVGIYFKMWTYTRKYGHNIKKMDRNILRMERILENDTFGLSKSGRNMI